MRFFQKNAYGLGTIFALYGITDYHAKCAKKVVKKKHKKKGISFFETLF
jgi:hypothetical protein